MAWIESRHSKKRTVTWFVYWREGGRGTAKRCIKAGTRRRDAERLAVEIQARLNAGLVGGAVVAKPITFDDFADKWLAMRLVRSTTLRRDTSLINTHLRPAFAGRMLHAIGVDDVRGLLAKVAKQRSLSTSRRLLGALSKMFTDAGKADYIRQNPIAKLSASDKPRPRRIQRTFDLDLLLNLLRNLPERWSIFVLVAVLTGLRWGEITALKWPDVDFDGEKTRVRDSIPAGTNGIQEPKSAASSRSIDMLWPVRKSLLEMPRVGRRVFSGTRGGALDYAWFRKAVWRPGTRTLESRLRFHDLRHGFASLLLAWGEPILYVSQQLGHYSAAFTLTTYGHLIRQGRKIDKDEVLQRIFEAARHENGAEQTVR